MSTGSSFAPLHSQSDGSLLRGCVAPAEWVRQAARQGHAALALTDRDSLAHAVTFYAAARSEGVRPIFGLDLDRASGSVLALARDRDGFARLCELASASVLDPGFDVSRALLKDARGLALLSDHAATLRRLSTLPRDTLFTRLRAARSDSEGATRAATLARETRRALVATGEALWQAAPQREVRRVLSAVREKRLAAHLRLEVEAPERAQLLSGESAAREFEAFPEALRLNHEIADACRVELALGSPIFPRAPVPGGGDALEYLRTRSEAGLRTRYSPARLGRARARLRHELAQIDSMGFTPYFLLVADIVQFTRDAGIPCLGRGSGASCIVAYALGITNVDPLAHQLYFERFLHPSRPDCPDLDIDLCWIRRDEVIRHVQRTYGEDRTAVIGTHATFGFRSAFREVVKTLGVGPDEVDRLAARLPRELGIGPGADPLQPLSAHPPARYVDWREPALRRSLRISTWLEGHLHHMGMHPGGMVIADRPLTHYLALARSARGPIITQCEMHAVEALGLVKMDLLGNRAVTEIGDTLASLPEPVRQVAMSPPDADPGTIALLESGATLSCFQLESPAMRNLLQQLGPRDLADTIAAVALIRPGAAGSGMKERYVRRRSGLEAVTQFHPWLREALEPTYGLLIYEEDVIAVASIMLGESAGEGDLVRRAIAATRSEGEREGLGRTFVARCARRGVDPGEAKRIWDALSRFAAYAFCRAHAAGYGVLAYQTSYLKAHHPAEFYRAVFNNHQGMYPLWVHVEEARRMGVRVAGPCVNRSQSGFELESGGIRAGLGCVASLSEASRARLLRERGAGGPFLGLPDLLARGKLPERECRALIEAGALDRVGRTRSSLLFELSATHAAYRDSTPDGLFSGRRSPCALPVLPEYDLLEKLRREQAAAGFAVSAPPLAPYAEALERVQPLPASRVQAAVGREVRVAGMPCASRRVRTKTGQLMLFLTLADSTGLVECTFFPDVYGVSPPPFDGGPLVVEGRVEDQMGAAAVTARSWSRLAEPGPRGGRAAA